MENVENMDGELTRVAQDARINETMEKLEGLDSVQAGKITVRADRLRASRDGMDPAKVAPRLATVREAAEALREWRKNGKNGSAWKVTRIVKGADCSAVQYADRSNVTGSLVKIYIHGSSRDTRRQAQARASITAANARADRLSKMRATLAANRPGGKVWNRCTSRAQKKACKSRARAIARAIENGEY